jgi:hypothetical protein
VSDMLVHVIAVVAHVTDPRIPNAPSVLTTPIWTNMEDVSVTSTGPEKTVPSPLTTLVYAQAAVMAAVPAHQQRTVLHVYRTPARISSVLAFVISSLKERIAPCKMNTAVYVTLNVKAVPDHTHPTVSLACHTHLVMHTETVSVIHSGPALTVATV